MARTLVIAEPGCTHEGRYEKLVALLETASNCGADVWKPQWTSDPARMCERRHIGGGHPKREYYERAYSWLNFPESWHYDFSVRCKARGMQYAVTSFLPEDVWRVDKYVTIHKVASFEADDRALVGTAWATGKRVLRSAGMKSSSDVGVGDSEQSDWLLCTTAYPAPIDTLHLHAIRHFRYCGLSDHSRNVVTGAVAVGAGAKVVEAHYRLDDCDPNNPDYAVSFTPAEFEQYVQFIRVAEAEMGDSIGKPVQGVEEWALPYRVTT